MCLKKLAMATIASFGLTASTFAATITQWKFDSVVNDATTSTGTTSPVFGAGTASLVGGTTATFVGGNGAGTDNSGWSTTAYAAQSAGSGTRGVQFLVSTAGFDTITVSYDHRASGTASRWSQLEYTTNGGTSWTIVGDNGGGLSPHDTFYSFSNVAIPAAANEKAGFGIRILSIFSPLAFDQNSTLTPFAANAAYMRANAGAVFSPSASTTTGDYATGGTWRFDMVTVSGTVVPEPATLGLLAVGGLTLLARRRRA